MSAQEKTKQVFRFKNFPLDLLDDNEDNPNVMGDREFNRLVQNMEERGWTDPLIAAAKTPQECINTQAMIDTLGDLDTVAKKLASGSIRFNLVGGHHRRKAAQFLGFETGPVSLILDPAFDQTAQNSQLVRHNAIHGKMDGNKLLRLYNKHIAEVGKEGMADFFAVDEAFLEQLVADTAESLPPGLKEKFKEGAKEVNTVNELAELLNKIITTHGNTLPYGYMVFAFGSKDSVWLRVSSKTIKAVHVIGDRCIHEKRTVDDLLGKVVQLIAQGKADDLLAAAIAASKEVVIPAGVKMPTESSIENAKAVEAA